MTISDALLLESLRDGDEAAFEALFHRHYASVYRLLLRLVGNREEADELAQEVFIRLFRRPLKRGDNVSGWLYRVATNLGYNALRGEKRRMRREETVTGHVSLTAPGADAEMERRERERQVRLTLARMAPRQAKLLALRTLGFSYRELADILGLAPGSIGTSLARAAKSFRRKYKGEFDEGV
jgi:RNA polymerase sigma-70 factor (ECF subfamily)